MNKIEGYFRHGVCTSYQSHRMTLMKNLLFTALITIFASCQSQFSFVEDRVYGESQHENAPIYSESEWKRDKKEFKKNYTYLMDSIEESKEFKNAPDFLFLNKYLTFINEFQDKYQLPFKIKEEGQVFRISNYNEIDEVKSVVQEKIILARESLKYPLPLGGQYGEVQKIIAHKIYHKEKANFNDLSLAFLESISKKRNPEQDIKLLVRELDSLTSTIPINFSTSFFKISLDNNLEEKWRRPSRINGQMSLSVFLQEGLSHPHLSALNFLVSHRRFRDQDKYLLEQPLVLFDKGHILPAFAKYIDGDFQIQAILPYARGNGLINYGKARDLDPSIVLMTTDDFIYSYVFKDNFNPVQMTKLMSRAQDKTSILYGINKVSKWTNSMSQKYFFHKAEGLPTSRPLITEITAKDWYKWLKSSSNIKNLALNKVDTSL